MPLTYRIDQTIRRIVVTLTDPFEIGQVETYRAQLFADPLFVAGFDHLADLRITHYDMSSILLRGQAESAGRFRHLFSGRQALVCHDNRLLYGMARLYQVFSKPFRLDVKVFTRMAAADEWLDASLERQEPALPDAGR